MSTFHPGGRDARRSGPPRTALSAGKTRAGTRCSNLNLRDGPTGLGHGPAWMPSWSGRLGLRKRYPPLPPSSDSAAAGGRRRAHPGETTSCAPIPKERAHRRRARSLRPGLLDPAAVDHRGHRGCRPVRRWAPRRRSCRGDQAPRIPPPARRSAPPESVLFSADNKNRKTSWGLALHTSGRHAPQACPSCGQEARSPASSGNACHPEVGRLPGRHTRCRRIAFHVLGSCIPAGAASSRRTGTCSPLSEENLRWTEDQPSRNVGNLSSRFRSSSTLADGQSAGGNPPGRRTAAS